MLNYLKSSFSNFFFLPVQSLLYWEDNETIEYSTGQRINSVLNKIFLEIDDDVVLIDEWDANLDKKTKDDLSNKIQELSLRKTIIEVRH